MVSVGSPHALSLGLRILRRWPPHCWMSIGATVKLAASFLTRRSFWVADDRQGAGRGPVCFPTGGLWMAALVAAL